LYPPARRKCSPGSTPLPACAISQVVLFIFLILAILMSIRWNLRVILICIFLKTKDFSYSSVFSFYVCLMDKSYPLEREAEANQVHAGKPLDSPPFFPLHTRFFSSFLKPFKKSFVLFLAFPQSMTSVKLSFLWL
jgi:hypothetical protein